MELENADIRPTEPNATGMPDTERFVLPAVSDKPAALDQSGCSAELGARQATHFSPVGLGIQARHRLLEWPSVI